MEFFNEVEYVHDNEDESDPESRHGDKVGPLQHTRWPPVVRRAHSADENYQVQELKKKYRFATNLIVSNVCGKGQSRILFWFQESYQCNDFDCPRDGLEVWGVESDVCLDVCLGRGHLGRCLTTDLSTAPVLHDGQSPKASTLPLCLTTCLSRSV